MNWWYWTWVLYSATIVAILRGLSLWGVLLRAFDDGIARFRKRRRLQWPQPRRAPFQGMLMPQPERFWPVTGSTIISCTAPDTDLDWKCTKTLGWRADKSTFWLQGT